MGRVTIMFKHRITLVDDTLVDLTTFLISHTGSHPWSVVIKFSKGQQKPIRLKEGNTTKEIQRKKGTTVTSPGVRDTQVIQELIRED